MAYDKDGQTLHYRCDRDDWAEVVVGPAMTEGQTLQARLDVIIHLLEHSLEAHPHMTASGVEGSPGPVEDP